MLLVSLRFTHASKGGKLTIGLRKTRQTAPLTQNDGEDVVLEVEIVFEDVADEPREVVVEDEVDRPAALFGQFFDSRVTPKGVIDTSAHWYYVV